MTMRHDQGKHPEFKEEFRRGEEHAEPPKHQKPSVEYNLEKDPLQTGDLVPSVDLRERVAMGDDTWTGHRRSAGMFALFFMLLLVALGMVVIAYVEGFFEQLFGQ
jgi:hypothetical protein